MDDADKPTRAQEYRAMFGNFLCILILLPVWPLYGIRAAGLLIADFMDWLVEDRGWTAPLLHLVHKIERHFQTDVMIDAEYHAWQRRMRDKRIARRSADG